jgi:hypothetical protein
MLTGTAAVFSDADKESSCILGEEWLLLLVENVQLHYLRTMYVNKHQAIFILFSIFVSILLRLFVCSAEHN